MLMQAFKSAAELNVTEAQLSALQKTLVLLETGKLSYVEGYKKLYQNDDAPYTGHFNMESWKVDADCGTVCCIGGTAEMLGGEGLGSNNRLTNPALHDLFLPSINNWRRITPAQAATALRSYLTTGDARWDLAVA